MNDDFNLNKNMLVAMLASSAIFIIWSTMFASKPQVQTKKEVKEKKEKNSLVKKEKIKFHLNH